MSQVETNEIRHRARALLDAMDRQYGNSPFSVNVNRARYALRELLPAKREADDHAEQEPRPDCRWL